MSASNKDGLPQLTFREKFIPLLFPIGMLLPFLIGSLVDNEEVKFVCGVLIMSTLVITFLFRKDFETGLSKMADRRMKGKKLAFTNRTIYFRYPYEFKHSSIRQKSFLYKEDINEVCLNTFPPSLVINQNEIIFIPAVFKAELKEFAERNRIPLSRRFDSWAAINEVFLDTELTEQENQRLLTYLAKEGIPEEEVQQIRAKIANRMGWTVFYTWEWQYLGHYDILCAAPRWKRKQFYWWTMDIALRNYTYSA